MQARSLAVDFPQPLSQVQKNHVVLCSEDDLEMSQKKKMLSCTAIPQHCLRPHLGLEEEVRGHLSASGYKSSALGQGFQELVQLRPS